MLLLSLSVLAIIKCMSDVAPTCTFVLPSTSSQGESSNTPANGNSASKAKHVDPGHYVCVPPPSVTNTSTNTKAVNLHPRGLLVFIPGLAAADYTLFAEAAAATGLAVVVVSSEQCNLQCCSSKSTLNCSATDPTSTKAIGECWYNERLMHLIGNGTGGAPPSPLHYPSTSVPNSIVGRVKSVLSYLGNGGNASFRPLSTFLDSASGDLKWNEVQVGGHSCASYFPVLMATLFPVQRLVMTGGVGGALYGYDLDAIKLPASERYGFVRSNSDCKDAPPNSQCGSQCKACAKSGAKVCTWATESDDYALLKVPGQAGIHAQDLETTAGNPAALAEALGGARQLYDHDVCVYPGRPIMSHLCEICDLQTHRFTNGTPVLAPIWQYLVSNKLPATAAALADNVTCNSTNSTSWK